MNVGATAADKRDPLFPTRLSTFEEITSQLHVGRNEKATTTVQAGA
jgi:hypothetical protein